MRKGAPYSKPGTGKTKEVRAKSFRIQRQQARKRELSGFKPLFIKLKPSAGKYFKSKGGLTEARARKLAQARLKVVKKNLNV